MFWFFNIGIFLLACFILYLAGELIVKGLLRIAKYFGVTEFVVAFFIMAIAASLPNLFVGITSALQSIPELSFGDVMGNNLIALTLAVSLAVLFSPKKEIPAEGKTIQTTVLFTIVAALLPLLLIYDGTLTRANGIILIGLFIYYVYWLFSKKERFTKVYGDEVLDTFKEVRIIFSDSVKVLIGIVLLIVAAQGIVSSASNVAYELGVPLVLIGILILGFGSALPEVYFAISSARKNETSLILGNLMGAVIIPSTLILGIVAIISPISSGEFKYFFLSRLFLILAAIGFLVFSHSSQKITFRESFVLLLIYAGFLFSIFMIN